MSVRKLGANSYSLFSSLIIMFCLICGQKKVWHYLQSFKISRPSFKVSEMALMGHGAFFNKKIVLVTVMKASSLCEKTSGRLIR